MATTSERFYTTALCAAAPFIPGTASVGPVPEAEAEADTANPNPRDEREEEETNA